MFYKSIEHRKYPIVQELSHLHPVLQRVFAARNITSADDLDYSLSGLIDYRKLSNVDMAATYLSDLIENNKKVVIIGDFDADGATSTALLMLGFKAMGLEQVSYVVPNRFEYGYGLSEKIVDEVATLDPDWIVTVDNGICNHNGVLRAKKHGIKVMITDHHLPADTIPEAEIVVNPNLPGDPFPSKNLAGVGVAFYLLIALRAELRARDYFNRKDLSEPNLAEWLDLVALGTVADVVPLDTNNRRLVAQGVQRIRAGQCRPGITALLEAGKRQPCSVQASDLGFAVGPRLNAAGRLEDMSLGIECLLANDQPSAHRLAFELDELNHYRRELEGEMVAEAMRVVSHLLSSLQESRPIAVTLYDESWHQGIVGLVASRIKDKLNRPVIVFAREEENTLKGSGRSVEGVHLRDVLSNIAAHNPRLLNKFGGHAMAAGLSIEAADIQLFQEAFDAEVRRWLAGAQIRDNLLTDGVLEEEFLNLDTAQILQQAGPWGQQFPEPLFDDQFDVISSRIVGQKHLKLMLNKNDIVVDAIYFSPPADLLKAELTRVEVVYRLGINDYMGSTTLQLYVEEMAPILIIPKE